jgi:nucleoside-diphosphate-sugar epimerase
VVAVTGAASGLGRALVERLASRDDLAGLIGLDIAPALVDGVVWRTADVRDPLLATRLAGVTTVVHLATSYDVSEPASARRALNVRGTAQVLEAAHDVRARRVVLCTSTDVYGVRPDNPVPILDAAPLGRERDDKTLAGDHVEVERLAEQAAAAGLAVTVLRPATLVGLSVAYDGQVLRQLGAPRLLAVRGVEPLWQLCHVEDLLSALELATTGAVAGGLAVGCDGALPQLLVEQLTGRRRLELPASVALSTADRLHRLGVTTSSPRELDHLLGPLVVAAVGDPAAGGVVSFTGRVGAELDQRHRVDRAPGGALRGLAGRDLHRGRSDRGVAGHSRPGPSGPAPASAVAALGSLRNPTRRHPVDRAVGRRGARRRR